MEQAIFTWLVEVTEGRTGTGSYSVTGPREIVYVYLRGRNESS